MTSPKVTLTQASAWKQTFPAPLQTSDTWEQEEVGIQPVRHAVCSCVACGDTGMPLMLLCHSKPISMSLSNMPLPLDIPMSQVTPAEANNKTVRRNRPSARRQKRIWLNWKV